MTNTTTTPKKPVAGKWVTERQYAELFGLTKATLSNWRYKDSVAGRKQATEGFPVYRRFGRAIRYLVREDDFNDRTAA